ncbi:MAG: polyribonucleotide nucleotidyltransferase [Candidatus Pacebacteria bacterium]|nr:polyribonucleotide nucleotidyltransferase [Candidatus Paceibacterota bacterium]
MQSKEYEIEVAGKKFVAVFSDLAEQAQGSVMMKCEDTVVLATAVMGKDGKNNPGFFNLTVEYMERFYASGLILGGQYNKREGRPSDKAILASRVIDRTIRPLFEHHIKNPVQVIVTVLAVGKMDPTILAVNAVSLALSVSPIPWAGPVGAVSASIAKATAEAHSDEIKINDYIPQTGAIMHDLDLTVCGKDGNVIMIEASATQKSETTLASAIDLALNAISQLETWQKEIVSKEGKAKLDMPKPANDAEMVSLFEREIKNELATNLFGADSKSRIHAIEDKWGEMLEAMYEAKKDTLDETKIKELVMQGKDYVDYAINEIVHTAALDEDKRVDLRKLDEVRALYAKAGGVSSVLHGTGIFYRGETHVLSVATLGGPDTLLEIEGMEVRGKKRFMHHYNFPPYSVGETGRLGGINRREMGHGFLAEKALAGVIPSKDLFPYTIRVVSESTSSNGSTSQGSICAASIALMDAGVPILAPVAGIAMGVMMDEHAQAGTMPKYKILTDIQGPEDHHGDMDFKVAGTRSGITALQLDIKVGGIPPQILRDALEKAKAARIQILEVIEKDIPKPRADISPNAPKILVIKILPTQIGMVIGGGGKTVNMIRDKTGAEINIEDDGTVFVTGKNGAAEAAKKMIEGMTHEWKVGDTTQGLVMKILEIGAVVALSEYADGLVHISEIAPFRVQKVTDVLKEGQLVPIKVTAVDKERGRISLSIKDADSNFVKNPYPPAATRSDVTKPSTPQS